MFPLNSTNKALIITALLAAFVVLLLFQVHLKKKNRLIAETYFEILPDEEPEMPELAEVLKSLDDVIKTNRASNENMKPDDFDDKKFEEIMERIKNRETGNDDVKDQLEDLDENRKDLSDEFSSFEKINSVIKKRSVNTKPSDSKIKNSSVSFSLVDRYSEYLPPPIYLCESGGKVVITITVDMSGRVIDAFYNNASTTKNQCLVDHALEYALNSRFSSDPNKTKQLGTITFIFQGKS
ncbi:MAG: hypothetical protein HKO90_06050 [Flavobacteriaceae bacterium]|nr:hypothetical protein [Flavobacteriaceae bacterium]